MYFEPLPSAMHRTIRRGALNESDKLSPLRVFRTMEKPILNNYNKIVNVVGKEIQGPMVAWTKCSY